MRLSNLVVGWTAVVGVVRAFASSGRDRAEGELRYHVPAGQDAAAVLAALRQRGLSARIAIDGGYEDVVIRCDPERDRERVRGLLREAPIGMAGKVTQGPPIFFADEQAE